MKSQITEAEYNTSNKGSDFYKQTTKFDETTKGEPHAEQVRVSFNNLTTSDKENNMNSRITEHKNETHQLTAKVSKNNKTDENIYSKQRIKRGRDSCSICMAPKRILDKNKMSSTKIKDTNIQSKRIKRACLKCKEKKSLSNKKTETTTNEKIAPKDRIKRRNHSCPKCNARKKQLDEKRLSSEKNKTKFNSRKHRSKPNSRSKRQVELQNFDLTNQKIMSLMNQLHQLNLNPAQSGTMSKNHRLKRQVYVHDDPAVPKKETNVLEIPGEDYGGININRHPHKDPQGLLQELYMMYQGLSFQTSLGHPPRIVYAAAAINKISTCLKISVFLIIVKSF